MKTVLEQVTDALGEPSNLMDVFPLSPSAVTWGIEKGCTLKRALGKCWGIKARMPIYVQTGSLVDKGVMTLLEMNNAGSAFSKQAIEDAVYTHFVETRDDFMPVENEESYLSWLMGYLMGVIERNSLDTLVPVHVQQKTWLYIGDMEDVQVPSGDGWSPPGNVRRDWVLGYLDWTENLGGGIIIRDLKVTSNPTNLNGKGSSGVGRYKTAMFTYAASLEQRGEEVMEVSLYQLQPKKAGAPAVIASELYTEQDYTRIIQRYRQVRDHYSRIADGEGDFIIPPRGSGDCTERGCSLWGKCPMGGGGVEV